MCFNNKNSKMKRKLKRLNKGIKIEETEINETDQENIGLIC